MKSIFTTALLVIFTLLASAQNVGINTNTPATTLQVVGVPATASVADGISVPSLTGNQLKAKDNAYNSVPNGTLVYVTAAASPTTAKTVNVKSAGFYYLDGGVCQKVISTTIADTTNDAFINDNANAMVKLGTNADGITARSANTDFVIKDNGSVGIGTSNPTVTLEVGGRILATDELRIRKNAEGGQIILDGQNTGSDLNWTIDQINSSSNPRLRIFAGSSESNGIAIKENGNLGLGITNPDQKISAGGNISASGWVRGFTSGQLLNSVFIDDPGGTGNLTSSGTTNSWVDVFSVNYTPVHNNSKIMVQYHNSSYEISGVAANNAEGRDIFSTQLLIGSTTPTTNRQITFTDQSNYSNSQFRSGTLFPITGVATNSSTNNITIKVQVTRSAGDDNVTINRTNGSLIIQEIAN